MREGRKELVRLRLTMGFESMMNRLEMRGERGVV